MQCSSQLDTCPVTECNLRANYQGVLRRSLDDLPRLAAALGGLGGMRRQTRIEPALLQHPACTPHSAKSWAAVMLGVLLHGLSNSGVCTETTMPRWPSRAPVLR
jgi:hypothetical protein